jgi:uncharacterized protein (UPF0248 family)
MKPRDILNRLKWGSRKLHRTRVTILHRGAPNDRRSIGGEEILKLGRSFMRVRSLEGEVEIPYHRVLRIEVDGRTVWERT